MWVASPRIYERVPRAVGRSYPQIYERDIYIYMSAHIVVHIHIHMRLAALGALEQVTHGTAVSVFSVVHGSKLREEPVELDARAW